MKITIETVERSFTPDLKYPVLAKEKSTGTVIWFFGPGLGVVVETSQGYPTIELKDNWAFSPEHAEHWEILPRGTRMIFEQE